MVLLGQGQGGHQDLLGLFPYLPVLPVTYLSPSQSLSPVSQGCHLFLNIPTSKAMAPPGPLLGVPDTEEALNK